ncbi:DNA cytosine methyltransferase [Rhizobium leguminosarum]|uniref:DNA cytosine methyltransferase n=1 Tax=Rhizobium leguminosarum TaxID=384 RepID=UPI001F305CE9|nr:DNA cytosine methyltransferase [Rhizobium leguminosarum]UIJ81752.1 DNA cytosine methyltransferase [Rhizobium leguminosarum]
MEQEEGLYDLCHRDLVAIASEALPVFEDLFGDRQSLEQLDGEHAAHLVGAYSAFQQVAEGCFGYEGGLNLHQDVGLGEIDLEDAVDLLVPYEGDGQSSIFQYTTPLRVLELCAGAGGLALGLQSAGFRHVALYDNHKPSIESLKRNQPHWPSQLADIKEIPDEVLLRFEGIDLLAAGLPSGPGQDRERKPDLHPRVLEILQIVRPRAFILENDAGIRKRPSVSNARTATAAALGSMGYVVTDFSLDTAEFGLPHSTERSFLVGIDAEISRVFEQPQVMTRTVGQMEKAIAKAATEEELEEVMKFRPGYRRGVGAALAPVIAVHATPRWVEGQSDQQMSYDRWAKHWKGEYLNAMLPDIPEKTEKRSADGWSASGFRHTEIVDVPPSLEEVDNVNFKPTLTYGVLAAAQGFPAPWQFLAEGDGKLRMIQAALPPIMSKMVGLAVRTVMTGESFDLDEEVKATVIEDSKVGPQREGLRQAVARRRGRLPRNEIHAQAVRVLDGEELRAVESNHKKRTAVKAMMVLVQEERDRLAEEERSRQEWQDLQDEIWDSHSFPEGVPA